MSSSLRPRVLRGLLVALLLVAAVQASPASAGKWDPSDHTEISERDVFVIVGSALRNPDSDTDPSAHLFSVTGVALGLTWGQWQTATMTTEARQKGGDDDDGNARTEVRAEMSGLIPGGVYSLYYITLGPDSENPLCPGVERSLPLTARKPLKQQPDVASFVAGDDGTASFRGRVDGRLLDADQLFHVLIYHFDGETYDPLPNRGEWLTQDQEFCRSSFGEDAMRHVLVQQ